MVSWLRAIIISLLGVTGGVLGNLVAAIIQGSLGQLTLFQFGAMIVGIVVVVTLAVSLERLPRRDRARLIQELKQHRQELYTLKELYESGVPWTALEIRAWLNHKSQIVRIRDRLQGMNVDIPYDPIDDVSPPRLGCLIRLSEFLKRNATIFLFPIIFILVIPLSAVAQYGYLKLVATPTPTITPSPIPSITPTTFGPTPAPTKAPIITPPKSPTETPPSTLAPILTPPSLGGGSSLTSTLLALTRTAIATRIPEVTATETPTTGPPTIRSSFSGKDDISSMFVVGEGARTLTITVSYKAESAAWGRLRAEVLGSSDDGRFIEITSGNTAPFPAGSGSMDLVLTMKCPNPRIQSSSIFVTLETAVHPGFLRNTSSNFKEYSYSKIWEGCAQ